MSTNPLKSKADGATAKRSAQDWCDHGNAYLRGQRPAEHGKPGVIGTCIERHDVRWVVRNGHPVIEFVTRS
jgi:hypothetical protein